MPKPKTQVIITGYDYLAYRQLQNNPDLTLELPVRLGELPDGELDKLMADGKVKFWKDGVEVPIEAVPDGTIDASTVASLDQDGTLHILITPEITGTKGWAGEGWSAVRRTPAKGPETGRESRKRAGPLLSSYPMPTHSRQIRMALDSTVAASPRHAP